MLRRSRAFYRIKIALIKEKLCEIFWRTFFYVLSVDASIYRELLLTSRRRVVIGQALVCLKTSFFTFGGVVFFTKNTN